MPAGPVGLVARRRGVREALHLAVHDPFRRPAWLREATGTHPERLRFRLMEFRPPTELQGPAFTLITPSLEGLRLVWGAAAPEMCSAADAAVRVVCSPFPATRGFMMLVALLMLVSLWLLLTRTRIGLVIQASLTHPEMVEALGHNVPRVLMLVSHCSACALVTKRLGSILAEQSRVVG